MCLVGTTGEAWGQEPVLLTWPQHPQAPCLGFVFRTGGSLTRPGDVRGTGRDVISLISETLSLGKFLNTCKSRNRISGTLGTA